MNAPTRPTRLTRSMQRAALVVAATTTAVIGAAGATSVAEAAPYTGAVPYTPTITTTPGAGCSAVITATKLPQTVANQYRVKVRVSRFGSNCGAFLLGVNWKNSTIGGTGGQIFEVAPDGTVDGAPDNVLDGFGFAPGAGRVVATITTYSKYDESGQVTLPNVAGHAVFALY